MVVDDAYELAYREAVRALDHQLAAVNEVRSRAGTLLAAASIAVSLLERASHGTGHLFASMAIACFVLLTVCVLAILWPQAELRFETDPQAFLVAHLTEQPLHDTVRLELIGNLARMQYVNARHLARISRAFRIGACLLAIQIVWTLAAASSVA